MIKRFLRDETGLELSEYAVAAALVALACVAAFQLLGTNIGIKINELAGKILASSCAAPVTNADVAANAPISCAESACAKHSAGAVSDYRYG